MALPAGHTLSFRIEPAGEDASGEGRPTGPAARRIRLFIDGAKEPAAEGFASFKLDGSAGSALKSIQAGTASDGQVLAGGNALFERLRAEAIGAALEPLWEDEAPLCIRIAVPASDEALPWEAMVDDRRKRLAAAHRFVVVRDPDRKLHARAPRPRRAPLSILIVVPGRSRLQVDAEIVAIREAFERCGHPLVSEPPLRERVTVETLKERLEAKLAADGAPFDVVHFIGHGVLGTDGQPKLQLNDTGAGEQELSPFQLASLLEGCAPSLVVLNACHSGSAAEAKGLAGFGQELMGAGVQAVVAMQQAIRNDLAIELAGAFYGELARSGRVFPAITAGRRALLQKQQADTAVAFSIPVLFAVPGADLLFPSLAPAAQTANVAASPAPPKPRAQVPEQLLSAVLDRWCIPVLGPSLSTPSRGPGGASSGPEWTPGALARALAKKGNFPEGSVVSAMDQLAERVDHLVLQRVCQHFEKQKKRAPLVTEVKAQLGLTKKVPEVYEQLAHWPVSAFVCSHFDGFLADAFKRRGLAYRSVLSPSARVLGADDRSPLLVHMRGSIEDENSLCLTGPDHDRLLDAMMRMDAQSATVAGLVTARGGTCLLLLGATGWDPWLRHLLWRMVPRDSYEQNTLYIVQPKPTKADEAAWGGFSVEWIDEAPEDVIAAITEHVRAARESAESVGRRAAE